MVFNVETVLSSPSVAAAVSHSAWSAMVQKPKSLQRPPPVASAYPPPLPAVAVVVVGARAVLVVSLPGSRVTAGSERGSRPVVVSRTRVIVEVVVVVLEVVILVRGASVVERPIVAVVVAASDVVIWAVEVPAHPQTSTIVLVRVGESVPSVAAV